MKGVFTSFLMFCCGISLLQSQTYSITGKVVDTRNNPIAYANVLLLNASDSTLVKGTSADDLGFFSLEEISPKLYLLQASYVGRGSTPLALDIKNTISLGALVIDTGEQQLDEVVVTAKRPTLKRLSDRLVFEVENTVVSQGSSWDVLKNTPGLIVSQDEFQVRNRTANVYLNGRRIQLSEQEVRDLLEGLSGTVIKSVELFTNAPSNFDAEEGAVINIITNKNVSLGYKGSINGQFTQGVFPKSSVGTSHFYKSEKLNVFANYTFNLAKNNLNVDKGINFGNDQNSIFSSWDSKENRIQRKNTHSANLNLDYDFDEKNSINLSSNILLTPDLNWERSQLVEIRNGQNVVDSTFTTDNNGFQDTHNLAFDFSYLHKFSKPGASIKANAHYTNYDMAYAQRIDSRYFDENAVFLRNFGFETNGEQQIQIFTGQLDYQTPLGTASLEAGAKISVIDSESSIAFFDFAGQGDTVDPSLGDAFLYDEKVYAAYASFVKNWNKWSLKMGVRTELTDAQGVSLTLNEINTQNFFEPFPSLYLLYSPDEKHSFSFDYGRNVQRPRYNDLNPFRRFFNENDFQEGNPRLQPNFTNNLNFNYTLNSEFFFDIYYRDNGNFISQLVFQDNDRLLLRELRQNVLESNSYGLDFTLSKSIADPWFLYAYTSVFHEDETFLAEGSGNQEYTNAIDGFYVYVANYLTLSGDGSFTGELTFSHLTGNIFGSYVFSPSTNMTVGLRKSFWKDRAVFSISAEDLLGKANATFTSRYLNQDNFYFSLPETQFVRFGLTYNFGNFRLGDNQKDIDKKERNRLEE